MHGLSQQFAETVSSFLVPYYLMLALMNAVAAYYLWQKTELVTYFRIGPARFTNALLWCIVSIFYVLLASMAAGANISSMPRMPEAFRTFVNEHTGPVIYSVGTTAVLAILYFLRAWFVKPAVAWSIWNLMLLFLGLSMPDPDFYAIVAKPDNVPIVALVFLLAFFTWMATYRAVENDRRKEQGLPPIEKLDDEKVLVWPDLVYTEMICMIALSALLIFWAIWLQAPLEEPASSVKTPNPSKAPWYFLGLQEMLVYYDPWMAGVVLPSLIIVGLMAIPYIDFNKSGNGYYTIKERRFAYIIFQLGFLELWVTLIVLGTLLRGPNWNFFGPYEHWDAHKVEALNNVNLSEYVWQWWLGRSLPAVPNLDWIINWVPSWIPSGLVSWIPSFAQFLYILFTRELPGTILVLCYFILLPPILAVTLLRGFYQRMGFIRYMVLANLLLFMAALPIKMVLRWSFNLKYLIAVPEYFLNF
jgi:Cytochrome b(C-terminal)/b6/petD